MTPVERHSLIAGAAFVALVIVSILIWNTANGVFTVAILWLIADRVALHERADDNSDRADRAHEGIDDIKEHLHHVEPPGKGEHAKGRRAA